MKIDKWFHLYGRKDDIVFEEVPFEKLPSAQQKGKWLDRTDDGRIVYPWWASCECSQCENEGYKAWEFCPNCGADMRD